jgi:hypothetical protein
MPGKMQRKRQRFGKKAEIPHWLVMLIYILISLFVILILIGLFSGKMNDFLDWLENII